MQVKVPIHGGPADGLETVWREPVVTIRGEVYRTRYAGALLIPAAYVHCARPLSTIREADLRAPRGHNG